VDDDLRRFRFFQQLHQVRFVVRRIAGRVAFAVDLLDVEGRVLDVDRDFFDLALGQQTGLFVDDFVVRRRLAAGVAGDHALRDERQDYDQQDRECRAFEETPQEKTSSERDSAYQGGFTRNC